MTTKAQLRKSALGLPETEEVLRDGLPAYTVHGRVFAALAEKNQVVLPLDEATLRASFGLRTVTQAHGPNGAPLGVSVPLGDVNGMELNRLVFESWLTQAPTDLATIARAAIKGEAPTAPDGLPSAIGRPATRALLLAGITTLEQVASHKEAELLALHGMGPRALEILRDALEATGRTLAD